ncbi:MAG: L-2-amino-thiazoline-4-carboxylic acid hydrolase [Lachnospiraceae bacterium]|nr:L-2-amino-thiazoline-4-carboxylic acid hydrolase [Lachnospiraceae bacterium]
MNEQYTVEQHAVLIGLAGKYLEKYQGEYGIDLFVNSIVRYGNQRGRRMRGRAIRDGRPLNYETFLAYGELKLNIQPGDYSVKSESPVYINCCHRCMWDEGWRKYQLSKYGEWYCKYIDISLVQGFSSDMVMLVKSMRGLGDECCTFVNVGYEQTPESKQRIADLKQELNGKYSRDFLYHLGHFLNAVRTICSPVLQEKYEQLENDMKQEFGAIYGKDIAESVWESSTQDFEELL